MSSRLLGFSERYSLTRSLVGAQPAPFLAAVLSSPAGYDLSKLDRLVISVVPGLATAHPILFGTIADPRSRTPELAWLAQIRTTDATQRLAADQVDPALEEAMQIQLNVEAESRPLWRIFYAVLASGDLLIGFVGHHALFDGSAVLAVGRTLVASLGQGRLDGPAPIEVLLPTSPAPELHPALESVVAVAPSTLSLLRTIANELVVPRLPALVRSYLPTPTTKWTGSSDVAHPRRKHHRTLPVSPERVQALLVACRAHGVSITSFLHAAIASVLRPLAQGLPFDSLTNVDARKLFVSETVPAGAGTYVGVVYSTVPALSEQTVWDKARVHHAHMRTPTALRDSVKDWGMLAYVPDKPNEGWEDFFRAKLAAPKTAAFELSNLGRATFSAAPVDDEGWRLQRAIFSQTPLPLSAVAVFSVLSCETGMEVAVGWEDGVADVGSVLPSLEALLATAK